MKTSIIISTFASLFLISCAQIPAIPKTPESYTITGQVKGDVGGTHIIACPKGEVISVGLETNVNEIVFDIIDPKKNERIFIGSQVPNGTVWQSRENCEAEYRVRVYNYAQIVHLPVDANYTLTIRRSD